ncbi:MOSC domain-containing protein [Siminovitchia sp. FSL H7-0308]|uniref:MOSC domain-containing protein YiiM n=1 Tax=Siminovitchia thermophila TaxID=1245522 RepID=A0ABS2RB72_9BACI|nr:MOSC domain-containing protein [Siminovitchia thermophila]MBM7716849.1 MOSC domain-containing protein YiiM [Siminovitchia thermophila]
MKIYSLNVGLPQLVSNQKGQVVKSGIRKKPVASVFLAKNGFQGDDVADKANHGGDDRAVCFYPYEHYEEWNDLVERELSIPAFGENITIAHFPETEACVGDVIEIGEAAVQITHGRIPCAKIDIFNRVNGMFYKVIQTGKTGYFARVLKEGTVTENSPVKLADRLESAMTVAHLNHLFFFDRTNKPELERAVSIPELAEDMRSRLKQLLDKI